jgi:hypothetical protein
MSDPLSDLKFWSMAVNASKRTIYCQPEWESRVKTMIDTYGLTGVYKVVVSRFVPESQILIGDEDAMEASFRQAMQMMKKH